MKTLSAQERAAVIFYNRRIKFGDTAEATVWSDNFTAGIFDRHPEGAVVDIGCGIGRFAPLAADYGIRSYLGIDPAIQHVKHCKRQYPGVTFQQGEVRQLGREHLNKLGGFILLNVLMHIPRNELAEILYGIRSSLLPGAVGFVNTQNQYAALTIPPEMRHLNFSFYEMNDFIGVLRDVGFQISKVRHGDHFCEYVVSSS